MTGPLRDSFGTAKFRHEAIACVIRVDLATRSPLVLVRRRTRTPFAGQLTLPSGPVEIDETIGESVLRHIPYIAPGYSEQLETLSTVGRDPCDRTIATAYLVLVPWTAALDVPSELTWQPPTALTAMGFDHSSIVTTALQRLRGKLSYTNIAFGLAPATFTIAELRDAYTAVLGHPVAPTNLQRILTRRGEIAPTGSKSTPPHSGGRPAMMYRFTHRELTVTDPFAVLRPQGQRSR
ncbi:MAG: NUDIX hydrolase [Corynebacterium sp.]|nr:NUDIX hydrolase [Corynebacterium sp.]